MLVRDKPHLVPVKAAKGLVQVSLRLVMEQHLVQVLVVAVAVSNPVAGT
jgi:hypothetical protein